MDGGGISIPLTLIFIVLKLCGVITWSWLWVLSPLWISFLLGLLLLIVVGIAALIFHKKVSVPGPLGRAASRR